MEDIYLLQNPNNVLAIEYSELNSEDTFISTRPTHLFNNDASLVPTHIVIVDRRNLNIVRSRIATYDRTKDRIDPDGTVLFKPFKSYISDIQTQEQVQEQAQVQVQVQEQEQEQAQV